MENCEEREVEPIGLVESMWRFGGRFIVSGVFWGPKCPETKSNQP